MPTASLDPSAAALLRVRIRALAAAGGCGLLWTSHNMYEVQETCDRVLFLSRGRILLEGNPKELPRTYGAASLEELFIRLAREPLVATPLQISEYLGGLVLSSIVTGAAGLAVMLALATLVFGLKIFALGLLVVPFLLVLFLFGIALGVLASAMVLRLGPASEWLVWPIPALLSPFVGVFYPLSVLPRWMQAIRRLLPPSYVFTRMRAVLSGQPPMHGALGAGTALALGDILLASWLFLRVYRYAVRSGLLARYSAESAG